MDTTYSRGVKKSQVRFVGFTEFLDQSEDRAVSYVISECKSLTKVLDYINNRPC